MSENILSITMGKNIAMFRKKLGLTQKELAERLEISSDSMVRIEKGRISPKMSRIQDISNALECKVIDLFKTDEDKILEKSNILAESLKELPIEVQKSLLELIALNLHILKQKNNK